MIRFPHLSKIWLEHTLVTHITDSVEVDSASLQMNESISEKMEAFTNLHSVPDNSLVF